MGGGNWDLNKKTQDSQGQIRYTKEYSNHELTNYKNFLVLPNAWLYNHWPIILLLPYSVFPVKM